MCDFDDFPSDGRYDENNERRWHGGAIYSSDDASPDTDERTSDEDYADDEA